MTNEDWIKVGIGAGGLVAGLIGGALLRGTAAPSATGLSRLYSAGKARGHQIEVSIMAAEGSYLLEYQAPYGVVDQSGARAEALEAELFSKMEAAVDFPEPEGAAEAADEIMGALHYKPESEWTDTLDWSLKTE
jgi:hypothetical protein